VFAGSDAHTLKDLAEWLGKTVSTPSQHKETTWIKADPTFDGLTQTLVEPAERVRIQARKPDSKEPYKIIDRIHFDGTNEFPTEIVLNQNLVSIYWKPLIWQVRTTRLHRPRDQPTGHTRGAGSGAAKY